MIQSITIPNETLSECLNHALKDGYTKNFRVMGMGLWLCAEDGKSNYNPDYVIIPDSYHVAGEGSLPHTDIVYLIETMMEKRARWWIPAQGTMIQNCLILLSRWMICKEKLSVSGGITGTGDPRCGRICQVV